MFSCLFQGIQNIKLGILLQVLGIIGALDPHTHKLNQADLQGEGKLEAEGVRPQRPPTYHHTAEGGPRTFGEGLLHHDRLQERHCRPLQALLLFRPPAIKHAVLVKSLQC